MTWRQWWRKTKHQWATEAELYHWLALFALIFTFTSPLLAMIEPTAGILGFVVGIFSLFLAVHASPDKNGGR